MQGLEFMGQGIRYMSYASVFIPVAVVDCLYASAARSIVFGCSDFKLSVICCRADSLDEPFPESPFADDGPAVQVLKSPCDYFRGRCGAAVDHYDDRHCGIYRLRCGLVLLVGLGILAPGGYHQRTFRYEKRYYIDRFRHQPASVSPQVQYQAFHSGCLQFHVSGLYIAGNIVGKSALLYVSCRVIEHSGIFDIGYMDAFPHDGYVESVAAAKFLYFECYGSSRFALHLVAALGRFEPFGRFSVYGYDLVSAYQAVLVCRGILVRLIDHYIAVFFLVDDGADSSICL